MSKIRDCLYLVAGVHDVCQFPLYNFQCFSGWFWGAFKKKCVLAYGNPVKIGY